MCNKLLLNRGFSLVEVMLAIAVVCFSLLTLIALLPGGLKTTSDSAQKTVASSIMMELEDDMRATPTNTTNSTRFQINLGNPGTSTFFFDNDGNYSTSLVSEGTAPSLYQATVVITNPVTTGPTSVRIVVSWPALGGKEGALPTHFSGYCETVTALDRYVP